MPPPEERGAQLPPPLSRAYHEQFLRMSVAAFWFGIFAAVAGIVFALVCRDKVLAPVVSEIAAGLGFSFARWYQKSYEGFLARTTQTERAADLLKHSEFREDSDIRKEIVKCILPLESLSGESSKKE